MIKAIIVDDEKNGRENLHGVLTKYCPDIDVVVEADSAISAIDAIQQYEPDLVFLDIEMPGGNGFKVFEFFTKPNFKVIFVTAYDQYAIQAIRFAALDYILKPIDALKLKAAVNRYTALQHEQDSRLELFIQNNDLNIQHKKIALPTSEKIDFVEINKIMHCKGEANYTRIYLSTDEEYLISKPLIEYEEILDGFGFVRTHKTHLVNLSHVSSFIKTDGGYLKITDGSTVPVSRRKKEFVIEALRKV